MSLVKVLVADDDIEYRNSIVRALFCGYEVDFASTADEEIEKARQNQYSLILTDNQMEDGYGNSGIYAIEQIRKFDKEVPIIFHTADTAFDVSVEALAKGATEVVSKRTGLGELQKTVRKYLTE